jgi:hypothetical protein
MFRVWPVLQRAPKGVQGIHGVIDGLLFFDIGSCCVKQFAHTCRQCLSARGKLRGKISDGLT